MKNRIICCFIFSYTINTPKMHVIQSKFFFTFEIILGIFLPSSYSFQTLFYIPLCSVWNLWPLFSLVVITCIHVCVYTYMFLHISYSVCILLLECNMPDNWVLHKQSMCSPLERLFLLISYSLACCSSFCRYNVNSYLHHVLGKLMKWK